MKIRLLVWLCVMVTSAMMVLSTEAQQRAARVALVIGNASYPDASTPLSTRSGMLARLPRNSAASEFEVDLKENVGKEEMQRAIDAFTGKIRSGMAALFYFSGYGIQVARQTYLLPINAQVWTEAEVRRDGISVDAVLAEMHRKGAKVKIVIIDAARRNPFERRFRAVGGGAGGDRCARRHARDVFRCSRQADQRRHRGEQPVRQRADQGAPRSRI